MTDIDFDELDRAVSSIMSPKVNANDDEANDELEVNTPEAVEATSGVETKTEDNAEETGAVAPTIVAKKRGQFMDVMHPSADMRTRPDPVPASRRATMLQPSATFEKNFTDSVSGPVPQTTEVPADTTARSTDWPDSIDLAAPDVPETTVAPDTAEPESQTPLVSPFLPDTKPEKRPLGSMTASEEEPAADQTDEPADSSLESGVDEPANSVIPMPAELSSDIMSVESGSMPLAAATVAPSPVQPIEEPDDSPRPSGPSSISPQYQTSEPPEAPEHAALYDTASQQEVTHPAKKRSGWLIPLVIISLLILGAAGGYFVYTMHIFG